MIVSIRRTLGRFARRNFAKLPTSFPKARNAWLSYFKSIRRPSGWKRFFMATSFVSPVFMEEKYGSSIAPVEKKDASNVSSSLCMRNGLSPGLVKFFSQRCLGLAHLGMFAAIHINPAKNRKPFSNLNEIFNLTGENELKRSKIDTKMDTHSSSEDDDLDSQDDYFDTKVIDEEILVLKAEDIQPGRWEALSNYLKRTPRVKILRLQGVEITTKELNIIATSLKQIRHITFCDNSIGLNQDAFDVLCATLLCCSFLESTSIIRNSLTDSHVPQIVNLISKHSSLKEISLCWNGIGDKGALQLAKAIEDMSNAVTLSLSLIDLSYNSIGHLGKEALRPHFGKNWRNMFGEPLCISLGSQM